MKKLIIALLIACLPMMAMAQEEELDTEVLPYHWLNNDDAIKVSRMTIVMDDSVSMILFSGITVADYKNIRDDLLKIEAFTDLRVIDFAISSGGGSAFDGLSIASLIEEFQVERGFTFRAHATGIVASAAVPIFAVCQERTAAPSTLFMVHEPALWKWPGRESASDIQTQGKLMTLLQDTYRDFMVRHSNLSEREWEIKEKLTTWFTTEQAQSWGLLERGVESNIKVKEGR